MKIIIAPAKKMQVAPDDFAVQGQPQYLAQTNQILRRLRELTYAEAHQMWRCSDKLARTNYDWLQRLELTQNQNQTPAVMAYSSLQYQARHWPMYKPICGSCQLFMVCCVPSMASCRTGRRPTIWSLLNGLKSK